METDTFHGESPKREKIIYSDKLNPTLKSILDGAYQLFDKHYQDSLASMCRPPNAKTTLIKESGGIRIPVNNGKLYANRYAGAMTDSLFEHLTNNEIKYAPLLLSIAQFTMNTLNHPHPNYGCLANAGYALFLKLDRLIKDTTNNYLKTNPTVSRTAIPFEAYLDGVQRKFTAADKEFLRQINEQVKTRRVPSSLYNESTMAVNGLYEGLYALLMSSQVVSTAKAKTDAVVAALANDERLYRADPPRRQDGRDKLVMKIHAEEVSDGKPKLLATVVLQRQHKEYPMIGYTIRNYIEKEIVTVSNVKYLPGSDGVKTTVILEYDKIAEKCNGGSVNMVIPPDRHYLQFSDDAQFKFLCPRPTEDMIMVKNNDKPLHLFDNYGCYLSAALYYSGKGIRDGLFRRVSPLEGFLYNYFHGDPYVHPVHAQLKEFIKHNCKRLQSAYDALHDTLTCNPLFHRYDSTLGYNYAITPTYGPDENNRPEDYMLTSNYKTFYFSSHNHYWIHVIKGYVYISVSPISLQYFDKSNYYCYEIRPNQHTVLDRDHTICNVTFLAQLINGELYATHIMEHLITRDGKPRLAVILDEGRVSLDVRLSWRSNAHHDLMIVTPRINKSVSYFAIYNTNPRLYENTIYVDTNYISKESSDLKLCYFDTNFNPPLLVHTSEKDSRYPTLIVDGHSIAQIQSTPTWCQILRGQVTADKMSTDEIPHVYKTKFQAKINRHRVSNDAAFIGVEKLRIFKDEIINIHKSGLTFNPVASLADINIQTLIFGAPKLPVDVLMDEPLVTDGYDAAREAYNDYRKRIKR